jgi:AraC-like DNA-binding protein
MEREFTRSTLQGVYQMVYEIGKGNLAFQIKRTGHRDELEGLIALFNLMAKRLNRSRKQFLWANRYNEVVVISMATFLLDDKLRILDYECEGEVFDEINQSQYIKGEFFETLLSLDSRAEWRKNIQSLSSKKQHFLSLQLQYEFYEVLELNLTSVITKVPNHGDTRFTINSLLLDTQKDEFFNLRENASINKISTWDQQLFLSIEEYILDHIKEPPKKNYELARIFNTNEHKIKTGFKKIFGLTPAQYHKKQRIKQCKILVENTDFSLTNIAVKMGFKTYPKFSRYFKREVKMTPKSYRERGENNII